MNLVKISLSTLFFILIYESSNAQTIDSTNKQNSKQLDSTFLKHPFNDKILEIKANLKKTWNNAFVDFKGNDLYFFSGMSLSKQQINTGNYNSNFNYNLSEHNNAAHKPGYFAGIRLDGRYKDKHLYSFLFSLNKIASGAVYKNSVSLSPFLGNFSKFKADDQFFNLNVAVHYKKQIHYFDLPNKTFYIVGGPSIEARLSKQTADNLVNYNYRRFLIRADLGVEFTNDSFYTLFIHYKKGITSFTKSPINTQLNSFELGLLLKASDIF